MDVSYTLFYLLSFCLYLRSSEGKATLNVTYMLSVICFFFATLCKEPGLTLPLALLAYDFTFNREGWGSFSYTRRFIPYILAAAAYLLMRVNALGGFAPIKTPIGLTAYQYFLNTLVLFTRYLEKLFFPVSLNVWHVFHPVISFFTPQAIMGFFVLLLFLVVAFISARTQKINFFCLLMIVIPLLPGLYIPGLTQGLENAFTERYLYLPSVGFVLMLGALIGRVMVKAPQKKAVLMFAIFTLIGLYTVGTISRNPVWKDSYTLWSDALKKSPESAFPHLNLGYALFYKGQTQQGKEHFAIALRLKPGLIDSVVNKGMIYARRGLVEKALFQFHIALLFEPDSVVAHYNLGLAYDQKGWLNQAIEHYQTALKLKPDHVDAHVNLGIAYGQRGLIDKALDHFHEALSINPNDPVVLHNLANAYRLKGMNEKAEDYLKRAERTKRETLAPALSRQQERTKKEDPP